MYPPHACDGTVNKSVGGQAFDWKYGYLAYRLLESAIAFAAELSQQVALGDDARRTFRIDGINVKRTDFAVYH